MNKEKYKDPTAEYAIAEAEKWERQQKQLEEKHGIKRGDVIQIIQTSYASGDGKIITKKGESQNKSIISPCSAITVTKRHNQIPYILGTGTTESRRRYRWTGDCRKKMKRKRNI